MPLGNKVPRDSFHEKLESLASQEFPTYFCQVQIQTKHFKTKARIFFAITGISLSEALLFAERGENMLCTKIVLNVRNNFCTQHVLPRFELGIFMY